MVKECCLLVTVVTIHLDHNLFLRYLNVPSFCNTEQLYVLIARSVCPIFLLFGPVYQFSRTFVWKFFIRSYHNAIIFHFLQSLIREWWCRTYELEATVVARNETTWSDIWRWIFEELSIWDIFLVDFNKRVWRKHEIFVDIKLASDMWRDNYSVECEISHKNMR